ncbi:MAG: hypothetical protein QW716_01030 [Desulfurococcaceae archaeon]
MRFRINYRIILGSLAVITVVVFITIYSLMRTNVYSEPYSPIEDYDRATNILWTLTVSIDRKTEIKPTIIYELNIVSDNLSRYRSEAMYRTGLSYRDFYTIDTYFNITKADKEMFIASHILPSTWLKIVESINLLGSMDMVRALEVYREIKANVIYVIEKLENSLGILENTSYREYAVKEEHVVKIDEACRVVNKTISILKEYIKLMELMERTRLEIERGGNVTESILRMIEEIRREVNTSLIEEISPAINDFISRASKNPGEVVVEKRSREDTLTHPGVKSGGYGEEVYDD